jgi:hypothetical protein
MFRVVILSRLPMLIIGYNHIFIGCFQVEGIRCNRFVLHEAVSSELILAVCDLTSLELFFHMYIGETFRVQI